MPDLRAGGPELRGRPVAEFGLVRLLPAVPRSAELARAATRVACRSWGVPEACDTAALLTTELVGNSVRHARTRNLVLRLSMTPRRLRIAVADGDPTMPSLADRDPLDEAGRGLWLVSQMAQRWGVDPEPGGKAVWAEMAVRVTAVDLRR